jgi:hypothetical protein
VYTTNLGVYKIGASPDPVSEQAKITENAVATIIEQFKQQANSGEAVSADTEIKLADFNSRATAVLIKYESKVKNEILAPFKAPVSVFLKGISKQDLDRDHDRLDVSENISIAAISRLIQNSSDKLLAGIDLLFSIFPEVPVYGQYAYESNSTDNNIIYSGLSSIFGGYCNSTTHYSAKVRYYFPSSGAKILPRIHQDRLLDLTKKEVTDQYDLKSTEYLKLLLSNCYSANCFYATLELYGKWLNLVEEKFSKINIVILHQNGYGDIASIKINAFAGKEYNNVDLVFRSTLKGVTAKTLNSQGDDIATFISRIPDTVTKERYALLTALDTELAKGKDASKDKLDRIQKDLCDDVSYKCLLDSEKSIFDLRYSGSKALKYLKAHNS